MIVRRGSLGSECKLGLRLPTTESSAKPTLRSTGPRRGLDGGWIDAVDRIDPTSIKTPSRPSRSQCRLGARLGCGESKTELALRTKTPSSNDHVTLVCRNRTPRSLSSASIWTEFDAGHESQHSQVASTKN